jgi:hypothetical protein
MTMTGTPLTVDRETYQKQVDELRVREKAHTREGDAIAAARRRLPMVEVDPTTPVVGAASTVRCSTHSRAAPNCSSRTTCGTMASLLPISVKAAHSTLARRWSYHT